MSAVEKGLLVVLSAPSGGGKGTVMRELLRRNERLRLSVSATTRQPRPGEVHGEQYFFVTREAFEDAVARGEMLEYAEYCGNYYGTPRGPVEQWREEGYDVVLEIEVQGGAQIKKAAPDCVSIFLLPPSLPELEKRLRGRGTETETVLQSRLHAARAELAHAKEYDFAVVNDTVEEAVERIESVLKAARLRTDREAELIERIMESC